ncbi:hypothetical protein GQX74_000717 [Glossina fuscipes]|nr:hypothetical protein GQX74_000717 [Glossina fuscipes]
MNCDEISEIKKTWEIPAASPTESGVAILIQFFTKYPSNLEKFSTFRDMTLEELKELKEVILEVLTAACSLNDQQIEIWVKLMDFIYDIIFRTIDELEQGA